MLILSVLPSSKSSSVGSGVGFGFRIGTGGGSPSCGAMRSTGGVGLAVAAGVCEDAGVGVAAGRLMG